MTAEPKKIVILGGGFGGVRAALDLARRPVPGTKIILISDLPHFEYHAALYRVVTGRTPLEVCVPLREIFANLPVEIICDRINKINLAEEVLGGQSGSRYRFNYLIIALGSETSYFGISGLPEFSFGFKSIGEALRLKLHLHQLFEDCAKGLGEDRICGSHIVVVGGGASGVELAGELAVYGRQLANKHGLDPALVTIDLIEAAPRLMPTMSVAVSQRIKRRLHNLGVNVFLNQALVKEELSEIKLKAMTIQAKTIIWTAGIKNNSLLAGVSGFTFDKQGKVIVDDHLRPAGYKNVFVVGDSAAVSYSGMAQTAVANASYAAYAIRAALVGKTVSPHQPKRPFYSIPIGPGWAVTLIGSLAVGGRLGWWLRRYADFRYFRSILPLGRALVAFDPTQRLVESCPVCNPAGQIEFK